MTTLSPAAATSFEVRHLSVSLPEPYDQARARPLAEDFAKRLKAQGYRFVGPTSVYAFMQNVGVINDHLHGCIRAVDYQAARRSP